MPAEVGRKKNNVSQRANAAGPTLTLEYFTQYDVAICFSLARTSRARSRQAEESRMAPTGLPF